MSPSTPGASPSAVSAAPRVALSAVLCGGASQRMGTDKALLALEGRSLLSRSVENLAPLGAPVVLACGSEDRYAELGCERVLDRFPAGGPLAGLEAVLARACSASRAGDVFVCILACDMPRAAPQVFERLLQRAHERGADACLFATDAGVEPLLAVYSTRCLAAVRGALDAGERRMIAFHSGFGELSIETLDARDPAQGVDAEVARNLNTPADFQAEGELAR